MKKLFTIAALLFAVSAVAQDGFITKALNDNDEPTFNWNKASKFIPIAISESVGEAMPEADVVFDATIDDNRNFLYVWDNTYAGVDQDGSLNSFGQPEDHIAMDVTTFGWSGCGFCAVNATQDWSVLDDSWVLHFAIKSTDNASHQIVVGEDFGFTLGSTELNGAKVLGDFARNGEWYYVDLPFSVIKQLATVPMWGEDPTQYTGNYLKILSGGVQGTQLRLDNIFWYKDNTIQVLEPIDDVYVLGEIDANGWAPNQGLHLTEMEDGVYVGTFFTDGRNDGYNYFGFSSKLAENNDQGGWDYIAPYRFGAVSEGDFWVTEELYGQPLELTQTDYQAFRVPFGYWDIKVDINDMVVVLNKLPEPIPEVYILGEVNGNMWDPTVGVAMETEDGLVYTAEIECDGRNDGYNYFSFTKHLGEDPEDWDAIADYRFGAVSEGDFWVTPELLGQAISLTGENGQALMIAAGKYNLTLDMGELTLVIESNGVRGDLNGDGIVDVTDVSLAIDIVLGKAELNPAADLDGNGEVDVTDVSMMIDIVLGK